MAGLDNKISNIIGIKIPEWLYKQFEARSTQNAKLTRDVNNLLYLANKTAWIRLVSSINITDKKDQKYFSDLGADILVGGDSSADISLAQEFTLFGGTSLYLTSNQNNLRSGFKKGGSYGILGSSEVKKYGYRPMPGIVSANIETQGRLGSVRAATVNFKCWDKDQLDIIDALYFKLGFSMLLEWGHTYYYPSSGDKANSSDYDANKVRSTEFYTIDPFNPGLNKEEILRRISQNSRSSDGNYDAMLGIVTNFTFSFNQEGGYDCTLKLISLGALGDSIKINNANNFSPILKREIEEYNKVLQQIQDTLERGKKTEKKPIPKITTFDDILKEYSNSITFGISYPSDKNSDNSDAYFRLGDPNIGVVAIRSLNKLIPIPDQDDESSKGITLKLNAAKLLNVTPKFPTAYSTFKDLSSIIYEYANLGWYTNEESIGTNYNEFKWNYASTINKRDYSLFIQAEQRAYIDPEKLKQQFNFSEDSFKNATINRILPRENSNQPLQIRGGETAGNQYIVINRQRTAEDLKAVLEKPEIFLPLDSIERKIVAGKITDRIEFTVSATISYTQKFKVQLKGTNSVGKPDQLIEKEIDIPFIQKIKITFDDTSLILDIKLSKDIATQPTPIPKKTEGVKSKTQDTTASSTKSPLDYLSSLELILRTIQVHSLSRAVKKYSTLDKEKPALKIPFYEETDFVNSLFKNGLFSDIIQDLINGTIEDKEYDKITNQDSTYRDKVHAKYGFATNLLANKESLYDESGNKNFSPVNYKELLTSYVVPYNVSQELENGMKLNHPVYMSFGTLLMILNHSSIIYDVNNPNTRQVPLVYLDFNPEHNFCLTHPSQLSTDPFKCLISYDGTDEDYTKLFDENVLENKNYIKAVSGSEQTTLLFKPKGQFSDNRDNLSFELAKFKYSDGTQKQNYVGKIMNILLSIDYITQVIKNFTTKNDENKVFLKPFLDQILVDIEKNIGNINVFRLSYNDAGNAFQITDDQITPNPIKKEEQLIANERNNRPLPIFGKNTIAKSVEIRTEMSSKLSNMLAISANSNQTSKSTLSTNGDIVGFINSNYVDRYINNRQEFTSSKNDFLDGKINSAIKFNDAIKSFYGTAINPSEQDVGTATNYFIEKLTNIKGNDPATRASAMIPVSVNFKTDGISGFNMGQAFTIPSEMLPYTYSDRIIKGQEDHIDKVGFVVTGLSHTIENNVWDTSVKANMIFLKNSNVYNTYKEEPKPPAEVTPEVSTPPEATPPQTGTLPKWEDGKIIAYEKPVNFQGVIVLEKTYINLKQMIDAASKDNVKLKLESGYRSYDKQLSLRKQNVKNEKKKEDLEFLKSADSTQFNPETGKPGYSKHQNGVAFDVRTKTPEGKRAYEWLSANAEKYGFIRTVRSELWHWEYRPGAKKYSVVPKGIYWNYSGDSNSNTA